MAVIALTSAKGAPGVTTSAVSLALIWPRPVLLLEADVSGSSSILAGYFRGRLRHDRGLIDLAAAFRQDRLGHGLREAAFQLGDRGNARFIPGLTTPNQVGTMGPLWEPIADELRAMGSNGVDVLIDAGRAGTAGGPIRLLREADLTLLVTRSDLPAIAAARSRAAVLREDLTTHGRGDDSLWLLMVGEGQPFRKREAHQRINAQVAGVIDYDPTAAQVISLGTPPDEIHRYSAKKFAGSGFVRSTRTAAASLDSIIRARQERLAPEALAHQARGGDRG